MVKQQNECEINVKIDIKLQGLRPLGDLMTQPEEELKKQACKVRDLSLAHISVVNL